MWRISSPSERIPVVEPALQQQGELKAISSLCRSEEVSASEFAATQWALAFLDLVRDGAI